MAKPHSIDLAGIYENDTLMLGTYTQHAHRNAQACLRRRGFRLSGCKEAYYHPDHWDTACGLFGDGSAGDTWIFTDAFRAKTDAARAWLKKLEEE